MIVSDARPPSAYRRAKPRQPVNRLSPGGSYVIPDPRDKPVLSAEEAFAELGIDRSTGYKAIRDGTFPVPVLRIGRLIRVPTVALRRLLQLDADPEDSSSPRGDQQEAG